MVRTLLRPRPKPSRRIPRRVANRDGRPRDGHVLIRRLIAFNTQRAEISRGFTLFTVIDDSAWVLASVLLLVLLIFSFTTDAKWSIGITAICVDIFATIQFWNGASKDNCAFVVHIDSLTH